MAKKSKAKEQPESKEKVLEHTLREIRKAYGDGSIMKMDQGIQVDLPAISTGSLGLDEAIGIGGLPKGRVVEIFGPESSGKTTLALHVVANAQAAGGVAAFIDAEHAFDPTYARRVGVDTNELLVSQPDHGEQALEIADILVRSGALDVIVIDSVAALVPKAELEGEMGDAQVGSQARLMSQALRKLTATVCRSKTCLVFINQLRMKIGVMFGSPETTSGGRALRFYASVRLDIRRIGKVSKDDEVIGNRTRVKVVKNKVAPPFRETEFDILFGHGICRESEVLALGVASKVLEQSGSWYSFNGQALGNGREQARLFLKQNPDLAAEIILAIRRSRQADAQPAPRVAKAS
jgi:recombination protein RecA